MAFDDALADRIRACVDDEPDLSERKMFGGIAFMVQGNMFCGVIGEDLMVRLGEDGADGALDEPHTRPMDFTGKPMKTTVYVAPEGTKDDDALCAWVDRGRRFASSLPPK